MCACAGNLFQAFTIISEGFGLIINLILDDYRLIAQVQK